MKFKKIMPYLNTLVKKDMDINEELRYSGLFFIDNRGCKFNNYENYGEMDHLKKPFFLIIPNLKKINPDEIIEIFNNKIYDGFYILCHRYERGGDVRKFFFEYKGHPVVFFKGFDDDYNTYTNDFTESKREKFHRFKSKYIKVLFSEWDKNPKFFINLRKRMKQDIRTGLIKLNNDERMDVNDEWIIRNYSVRSIKFLGFFNKEINNFINSTKEIVYKPKILK